jgi:hypothetical protein
MEIRSYRRVFDLERRVYSVDRLRLNPGGVPVRGILYGVAMLAGSLIAGRIPLLGAPARALPWYLSDLALPLAGAAVLSVIRVEGRTFHLAAQAVLRHLATPRRVAGLARPATVGRRWYPRELLLLPDGSDPRLRRLRYRGPGAVLVSVEHERGGGARERGSAGRVRRLGRRAVTVREARGGETLREGEVIALAAGASLRVCGRARGRG